MPSSSKRKGNHFEREVVKDAEDAGLTAERAYASNGKALGEHETVDLKINGYKVQAKRRKSLPSYIKPPDACDVTVIREDRGESLVVIPLKEWLRLIKLEKRRK